MPSRGDDDRPKRSWREIDRGRDRSQERPSRPAESPLGGGKRGEERQKTYRSQLDRLFESGGIGKLVAERETKLRAEAESARPDKPSPPTSAAPAPAPEPAPAPPPDDSRQKRLSAVRDAAGSNEITRAINVYLKAHPWPNDLEFHSAALEHRDDDIVRQALSQLEGALAAGKPRRAATLVGRLRTLEELGGDDDIRARATALRKRL
jgi:hypothetical protein